VVCGAGCGAAGGGDSTVAQPATTAIAQSATYCGTRLRRMLDPSLTISERRGRLAPLACAERDAVVMIVTECFPRRAAIVAGSSAP
jgi:hypothetical protein